MTRTRPRPKDVVVRCCPGGAGLSLGNIIGGSRERCHVGITCHQKAFMLQTKHALQKWVGCGALAGWEGPKHRLPPRCSSVGTPHHKGGAASNLQLGPALNVSMLRASGHQSSRTSTDSIPIRNQPCRHRPPGIPAPTQPPRPAAPDRTRRLAPAALSPSATSSDIATSCRRRLEPSSSLGTHERSGDGAPQFRIPRPTPNPTGRESCLDPPLGHRSAPASRAQDSALAGCRTEQLLLDTWNTSAWWKRWFMAIRARNSTQDRSRLPQGFTATLEASSAFLGSAKVMVRLESCE